MARLCSMKASIALRLSDGRRVGFSMVVSACEGFGLTQIRSEREPHQVNKMLFLNNKASHRTNFDYVPARTHGTFLRNER
ncbi:hypothetical protein GCM10007315_35820 [Gemmobacter tilapiae]|uniref:Uncharacterized protein n=2 Tax=Neogemmobacter tilapiae TaxID=875041 RepID=A0A918U0B3_9RHOB|nr:hypothetical protein GCM10007315_35820 [Gemmobacter tilapiae]